MVVVVERESLSRLVKVVQCVQYSNLGGAWMS